MRQDDDVYIPSAFIALYDNPRILTIDNYRHHPSPVIPSLPRDLAVDT